MQYILCVSDISINNKSNIVFLFNVRNCWGSYNWTPKILVWLHYGESQKNNIFNIMYIKSTAGRRKVCINHLPCDHRYTNRMKYSYCKPFDFKLSNAVTDNSREMSIQNQNYLFVKFRNSLIQNYNIIRA